MCQCLSLNAPPPSLAATPGASADEDFDAGLRDATLEQRDRALALSRSQPWADVHAHPGRCFLLGLPPTHPLAGLPTLPETFEALAAHPLPVVSFATVADLGVIGATGEGALAAVRDFEPGEAYRDHRRQVAALAEVAERPGMRPIRSPSDVAAAQAAGAVGVLASCEGADFLEGQTHRVAEAYQDGIRSITLVHYRVNELGDIQTAPPRHGGLTDFGRQVVREMNRLGLVVDLAHATFETTRDALDASDAPLLISHSHLTSGADPHPRLLTPEHALAVTRAGGVIGAWPAGFAVDGFEAFVEEVMRLIDRVGLDHVAVGTDMDANYKPVLSSYRHFHDVAAALLGRGLGDEEVGAVLGGNFLSLFERVTGAASAGVRA